MPIGYYRTATEYFLVKILPTMHSYDVKGLKTVSRGNKFACDKEFICVVE